MGKEQALAKLILTTIQLTKEANSVRGETKKTLRDYAKSLSVVCKMLDIDPEVVDEIIEPTK